ncbi:hypothetical protein BJV82DRAFT_495082, partial [Fennellomyces sp. T-0311]
PGMAKDFFRSPLPESDRRRFLAECPRNVDRVYTAPPLNNVQIGASAKRTDTQ